MNVGGLDEVLLIVIHESVERQDIQHPIRYQVNIFKLASAFPYRRPHQLVYELPRFNDLIVIGQVILDYRAIFDHRFLHRTPV